MGQSQAMRFEPYNVDISTKDYSLFQQASISTVAISAKMPFQATLIEIDYDPTPSLDAFF